MPHAQDIGSVFVTTMRYPPLRRWDLPWREPEAEVREVDHPYRIGHGTAYRVPFTRRAFIVGRWADEGGEEMERIRAALQARDLEYDSEEVDQWA